MTNNRFYNQRFIFSDGSIHEQYIWESDVIENNTEKFPKNDKGEIGEPFFPEEREIKFSVLSKMDVNQIRADRTKRSREHYKREVMDTIPQSYRKTYLKDKFK